MIVRMSYATAIWLGVRVPKNVGEQAEMQDPANYLQVEIRDFKRLKMYWPSADKALTAMIAKKRL